MLKRSHIALGLVAAGLPTLASCDTAPSTVATAGEAPVLLQSTDVTVLGTSDALAEVEGLDVLDDGTVWVWNSVEPLFIAFDPNGNVLQTHGSLGGGPEEFRAPAGFVRGGIDGESWIFDRARHALLRVSQPETLSEISLPSDSTPPGTLIGGKDLLGPQVGTARMGSELIVPRSTALMQDGLLAFWRSIWGADLMALSLETGTVRRVVALGEVLEDPTPDFTPMGDFPPFPLWQRLWDVCPGSEIRVFDRGLNTVRAFTGAGLELDPTPLPAPALLEVSAREFAGAVFGLATAQVQGEVGVGMAAADSLRLLNELLTQIDGEPAQLAGLLPRYVDLRCAPDGTVWIQPFDVDAGGLHGGPAWLRLLPNGATQEVRFPDRFDPHQFTDARIWGVQRDEFDVASVAWVATPTIQ